MRCRLLATLTTVALLAGCSPATQASRTGAVLLVAKQSAESIAGAGTNPGTLYLSDHRCVSLNGRTVVVPPGSTFDGRTVSMPGHGSLEVGKLVDTADMTPVDDTPHLRKNLPSEATKCGSVGFIWIHPTS